MIQNLLERINELKQTATRCAQTAKHHQLTRIGRIQSLQKRRYELTHAYRTVLRNIDAEIKRTRNHYPIRIDEDPTNDPEGLDPDHP